MLTTLSAWISIAQGLVTIFALLAGTYIAWIGLSTWKEQIRVKEDHDLARRALIAVHKVREAIDQARLSVGTSLDLDEIKKLYDERLEKVSEAQANLNVEILDARAMWGDYSTLVMYLRELKFLGQNLGYAYRTYYSVDPEDQKEKAKCYSILFADYKLNSADHKLNMDEFSKELEETIKNIEDGLRTKLNRNK